QSFSSYSDTSSGLYIAAVQSNVFASSSVDVALYVNGHRYIIVKAIKMEAIQATTANSEIKTKQRTADTTTVKSKAQSTTKEATTKFKPGQGNTNTGTIVQGTVAQTLITQPQYIDPNETSTTGGNDGFFRQSGSSHLSKPAIAMIITASAFALAGVICIISAAVPSKNNPPENTPKEKEN
ncbi:MAG: hypothetical protein ACI4IE_02185, partial [Eubacterium sp.]